MDELNDAAGDVDIEDKNVVGGLDRLVIWVGLAVLAILPTLFIVTFLPWRAAPLLAGEKPEGRDGYVLGPGVFFVAALISVFLLTGIIDGATGSAPDVETVQTVVEADDVDEDKSLFRRGYEFGEAVGESAEDDEPDDELTRSASILNGISSGNVWLAASSISPFFFLACLIAAFSSASGALLGVHRWTLRAAMGGGLYFATSFIVLTQLLAEAASYFLPGDRSQLSVTVTLLIAMVMMAPILILPWQTFWFVKHYGATTAHKSGLVTIATFGGLAVSTMSYGLIVFFSDMASLGETSVPAETVIETPATTPPEVAEPILPSSPAPSGEPPT